MEGESIGSWSFLINLIQETDKSIKECRGCDKMSKQCLISGVLSMMETHPEKVFCYYYGSASQCMDITYEQLSKEMSWRRSKMEKQLFPGTLF